jgi:chemotaxis protein CheX
MSNESSFLEFSRPFVEAAKNVFETMVYTKLDPKKPSIKKDNISKGDVSAVLGMTGEIERPTGKVNYKAMLVLSFPYATYFKVSGAMLSETYTSFVPDIHDVGGEIVNMIMGNAKRDLKVLGYTSNMAIPSMIEGPNHTITYPNGTTVILIPISSAHGEMFLELCYTESD